MKYQTTILAALVLPAMLLTACASTADTNTESLSAVTSTATADISVDTSEATGSSSTSDSSDTAVSSDAADSSKATDSSKTADSSKAADSSKTAGSSKTAANGILSSFTAQTLDGKTADASIFAGSKLTMVNVWATYCGPCLNEMPDIAALAQKYADQGFQVVGIISDVYPSSSDGSYTADDLTTAKELVAQTGASYQHLLPSQDLYNALLMNVQYVPTTLFIDSNGNQIGEAYVGAHSSDDWAAIIESLLKAQGANS